MTNFLRARLSWVAIFGAITLIAIVCFSTAASATNDTSPYGLADWGFQQKVAQAGIRWVRAQIDWQSIETSPGVYNWSQLDQAVAAANAAHVRMTAPIQQAPDWDRTQICNGQNLFPGPDQMTTFATLVAERYNGQSGHGYIDSIEIGNEEYDGYWGGSWAATLPCRTANWYGPVLKAGYQAIKAHSPTTLVGMFGLWWLNTQHFHDYLTWLYQNGYGSDMDFADFHYYSGGDPTITNGSVPSFSLAWQTLKQVQQQYGDANKPIWCTEVGWAVSSVNQPNAPIVSPAQQAQYVQDVLDSGRTSNGALQRVFIYTINDNNNDGMNLYPTTGPLPAYTMLEKYIATYPTWGAATPTPTPTPTPTATPAPTPSPSPSSFPCVVLENNSMVMATCSGTHSP